MYARPVPAIAPASYPPADAGIHDLSQAHGLPPGVYDRQLTVGCACRVASPSARRWRRFGAPPCAGLFFMPGLEISATSSGTRQRAGTSIAAFWAPASVSCCRLRVKETRNVESQSLPYDPGAPTASSDASAACAGASHSTAADRGSSFTRTDCSASAHRRPATGRESGSPCVHTSTCKGRAALEHELKRTNQSLAQLACP